MTNDDDLIRRGDAKKIATMTRVERGGVGVAEAIAALPAVTPQPRPADLYDQNPICLEAIRK